MQNFKETRLVHCFDLVSFVTEVEKAVKSGFSLDLVTPEHYPQQIGYQFITTMVKEEFPVDKLTINLKVDTTEVQKVVDESIEALKTLKVVAESTPEGVGSQEVNKETVEAPKKAGRPAKAK